MKCPRCNKNDAVKIQFKDDFSICPDCFEKMRREAIAPHIENRMKHVGVPSRYLGAWLTDFPKLDLDIDKPYFIIGPVDTGKTHLLAALVKEQLLKQKRCIWIKAPMFFADVRESPDRGAKLLKQITAIPYLFIDDLGAERLTDWVFECWYRIIDYRYSEQKYTSVTLNKVDNLDERLFRRLRDMTTLLEMNDD